jgi:hypothetical protein
LRRDLPLPADGRFGSPRIRLSGATDERTDHSGLVEGDGQGAEAGDAAQMPEIGCSDAQSALTPSRSAAGMWDSAFAGSWVRRDWLPAWVSRPCARRARWTGRCRCSSSCARPTRQLSGLSTVFAWRAPAPARGGMARSMMHLPAVTAKGLRPQVTPPGERPAAEDSVLSHCFAGSMRQACRGSRRRSWSTYDSGH